MRFTNLFNIGSIALSVALGVGAALFPTPAVGHGGRPGEEPLTRFEEFVLGCSPCVKESVTIATVSVPPLTVAALSQTISGRTARPGQIGIEVLRAHVLGQPTPQVAAVRLSLSITTGTQGETFRLSSGVVDEADFSALEGAVGKIASAVANTGASGADVVEIDAHTASVRVGVIKLKGESVAYVQAGDIHALARRPVWEAPGTLYLPVAELSKLRAAFSEASVKIRSMRP